MKMRGFEKVEKEKMKKQKLIKLKRYGRIDENPSYNFKKVFWSVKFGNDFEEGKDSSIIMKVCFDKKDIPDKNNLPLYKIIEMRWDDQEK